MKYIQGFWSGLGDRGRTAFSIVAVVALTVVVITLITNSAAYESLLNYIDSWFFR